MVALRALVRLAVRDARGHTGSSVLVVVLVALPVIFMTVIALALTSASTAASRAATYTLGQAEYLVESSAVDRLSLEDAQLPAGTRAVAEQVRTTTAPARDGTLLVVSVRVLDMADPLVEGVLNVARGTSPSAPGEVALSPPMVDDLGADVGDRVQLGGSDSGLDLLVTGVITQAVNMQDRVVVLAELHPGLDPGLSVQSRLFIGADPPSVLPDGLTMIRRSEVTGTSSVGSDYGTAAAVGGLLVVQAVLLCGAAFMVGATRRERELAAFAATSGATRADLGRVVTAGGALLGGVGATVGVGLGVAGAVLAMPWIQHLTPYLVEGVRTPPALLGGIWLVGISSALGAALVPAARTRSLRPLAALRRVSAPQEIASPGPVRLVSCLACTGCLVGGAWSGKPVLAAVGGAGLLVVLPVLVPLLVVRLEVFTRRTGPALRLAVQDLARHPSRSVPTMAALSASLAGAIAVGTLWASSAATQQAFYTPPLSDGHVLLRDQNLNPVPPEVVERLRAVLPIGLDSAVVEAATVSPLGLDGEPLPPLDEQLYVVSAGETTIATLYVGDPTLLRILGADESTVEAFERGSVVTWESAVVRDGLTTMRAVHDSESTPTTLPAVLASGSPPTGEEPRAVVSTQDAVRLGLPTTQQGWIFELTRDPTSQEREAAERVVSDHGTIGLDLLIDDSAPPTSSSSITFMLLASLALALGVVAVATALSAADLRPDLRTLAAVGAPRRTARTIGAVQAATVTAISSIAAVAVGTLTGLAFARAGGPGAQLAVPWLEVVVATALVVVLASVVGGAMATRNRPAVRR